MPNRVSYTFSLVGNYIAQAKRIARETRGIRTSMRLLSSAAKSTGRVVAGAFVVMRKAVIGLKTSMAPLIAAFAGIAGVLKFFSLGTAFQDAMLDLSAITGATGKDLVFFREESFRLGKEAKISAVEVAKAFKLVASAKSELLEDPKGLSVVTEQVLLLANATGLELADAANIALEIMNQFDLEANEAGRTVNALAAGAKIGAAEVVDLGAALINAGAAANLTGVGLEEMIAAIEVMGKKGIKGMKAGTGLQGALLKLDIALPKGIKGSKGLAESFQILAEAGLSTEKMVTLLGLESIKAGVILAQNSDLTKEWTKAITGTNEAERQAALRLSSLTAASRGLGVTVGNVLIRAFQRLEPMFQDVIRDMDKFFSSITASDVKKFVDDLKPLLTMMVNIAGAVSTIAKLGAPVFKLVGASAAGLSDLGTLATGGDLTAANSASYKNAARLERAELKVGIEVSSTEGATAAIKTESKGNIAGLKTGINNLAMEGA